MGLIGWKASVFGYPSLTSKLCRKENGNSLTIVLFAAGSVTIDVCMFVLSVFAESCLDKSVSSFSRFTLVRSTGVSANRLPFSLVLSVL